MIFVTVGFHYQGFERLIKKMDDIAGMIDEEVIMQIGSTEYKPENAKYFNFIGDDEVFLEYFKTARVIVSHAGAGTLLEALSLGKPIIVVPRLKRFGEHVDDQQLDLSETLAKEKKIISLIDINELYLALSEIDSSKRKNISQNNNFTINLRNLINCQQSNR